MGGSGRSLSMRGPFGLNGFESMREPFGLNGFECSWVLLGAPGVLLDAPGWLLDAPGGLLVLLVILTNGAALSSTMTHQSSQCFLH